MLNQKGMIDFFDPERCIAVSKAILNRDLNSDELEDEELSRTSIGRAYYGAFLYAKQKLEFDYNQLFSEDMDIHNEIQNGLLTYLPKISADLLSKLRKMRNGADYNLQIIYNMNMAHTALQYAQTFISQLLKDNTSRKTR